MDERGLADLIIARIPSLKPHEKVLLCKQCNNENDIINLSKLEVEILVGRVLDKLSWDMDSFRALAEQDAKSSYLRGIGYISCVNPLYPPLLREIYDPPCLLFYRGTFPNPEKPMIAIVGTRKPSPPAMQETYFIAKSLGSMGITVVSGLARGIDTMAHRGNLDGGAPTIAVLGTGLDEIYPSGNKMLARRIIEQGGVLFSEYPPATQIRKWHFPARNRIISALSRGTLIMEAPSSSGALITARFALEHGRDLWVAKVGAEDGVYVYMREGTIKLASEGAPLITKAEDILMEWGVAPKSETDYSVTDSYI